MKKNIFKVYGSGEELTWGEIPSKIAKKIISSGVGETQKDELISDSECEITSDIRIEVNGERIDINIADIEKNISVRESKFGDPKKWYLLEVLDLEGLFYETILDKPFDTQKITLSKYKYEVGGAHIDSIFYSISYDGQDRVDDFDFSQREFTAASYYVLSPKGEIFDVEITDDEDEDEDDEDDEDDGEDSAEKIEAGVLEFICDNSTTAEKLIAELSTWGSFYHEIKIETTSLPNKKVEMKIFGVRSILTGVDTVTNQPAIQALGSYTKKFLD